MLTWDDLNSLALARMFPEPSGGTAEVADPVALLEHIGPIQSQTARSTFLGLSARDPRLTHEQITEAFTSSRIVRGSTLRGTVHTSTAAEHRLLDTVTRIAEHRAWARTLDTEDLEPAFTALEEFAGPAWRSPQELVERLREIVTASGGPAGPNNLDKQNGKFFGYGHGGLLRRPTKGSWSGQAAAEYRSAAHLLGTPRVPDPEAGTQIVRAHLRRYGPASRQDIAWWSGLGLRQVDAALDSLSADLRSQDGPLGRVYHDLAEPPPPTQQVGLRLLPEFDAVLCAFDSAARDRFVTAEGHAALKSRQNGLILPPVLLDGRIAGWWSLARDAGQTRLRLALWTGHRRPRAAESHAAASQLAAILQLGGPDKPTPRVEIERI
ncbi:winged helix DNA-binding domain-containing protein [Dermacoccaceae bacterium W4C1]